MAFFGVGASAGNFNADAAVEREGAAENGPSAIARQLSHDKDTSAAAQVHAMDETKKRHETETTQLEHAELSTTDDSEKITDEERESARRDEEVHMLARKLTQRSNYSELEANPLEADEESRLNPSSARFNAKAWATSLMHLQRQDPDRNPERTSGVAFRDLNVHGFGSETDYQQTVFSIWMQAFTAVQRFFGAKRRRVDILRDFEGVVRAGEMLVVLGPPGSGCTTFLKTISGETHGFTVDKQSYLNYQGVRPQQMYKNFRGEAIYTAEVDVHFPQMTVKDTLTFAARARAPRRPPGGVTPHVYADHKRDVIMAMFGITHTANTVVGNDFIRGVSGGERKRVTIAEASLAQAPLQCWDNSTRGLDSANAIEFCKTLRISTDIMGATACVSIYQSPQSAYNCFDKVIVIYEGRQIFFGNAQAAKQYFIDLGFVCPDRQTIPDFLTSMTSPQERIVQDGWEDRAPRTPDEFATAWKASETRKLLREEIDAYDTEFAMDGKHLEDFKYSRKKQQSKAQRVLSPYTLSYAGQVKLCLWRSWQRLKGDPSITFVQIFSNSLMGLIVSSVFYNLQPNTNSFFQRGAVLFFAVLLNAFGSALEILTLYAQRPIVEKHARYAFYHPSAEAFASMLMDMPYKIGNLIAFNLVLYFMVHLRREPGAFFFFLLASFSLLMTMSMLFRFIASVSRTLAQAMAPTSVLMLALIIYTGFAIPIKSMLGWSRWINYVDPIAYGFESLMVNEFSGRNFSCSNVLPSGPNLGYNTSPNNKICVANGAVEGQLFVDGDVYLNTTYAYKHSHKWRNVGIVWGFTAILMCAYLIAAELVSSKKSKGEVLLFRRRHMPSHLKKTKNTDEESLDTEPSRPLEKLARQDTLLQKIQKQTAVFSWRNVNYEVKIKKETRKILDNVDGFVQPGTLTALMGVSGAGKTTLLDALATRTTMGVVRGSMLVEGEQRDESFQRKTGYVQQQDLHLETSTVREALNFSALLRQPRHIPYREKLAYVDEVLELLEMTEYADAVVGVPGTGLNVEQRKRLTIAVELAARPELLLFLDEPTSGLDSQTSWAICDLMEKLTKSGQAILCTIHQPSAMLFQRFDRLLFLKTGGQTVYFGEVGKDAAILTSYFERNGGFPCPKGANPAEWMLEVIGAAPGSHSDIDWHQTWRNSPEYQQVQNDLDRLAYEGQQRTAKRSVRTTKHDFSEFAAPFRSQWWEVQKRVFQQYWRTPSYIYSKTALCTLSSLFIGFSFFHAQLSIQGLTNQMFAIFMLFTIFGQLCQQLMPQFVTQRALYEVRERPSKAYSWKAFMLANILVEIPWQTLMAIIMYACWYYPVAFYRNAEQTNSVHERGALFFLSIWGFLIFTSTFAHMVIAAVETAEAGGNIANLMFSLTLVFNGILASPVALPGFWIFMYYVSPFTYLTRALLAAGIGNAAVSCADFEYLQFTPPTGLTCGQYMQPWIQAAGGYLKDNNERNLCDFCSLSTSNTFLASISTKYSQRWRNFGLIFVYIAFNICAALFFYWLVRVPKKTTKTQEIAADPAFDKEKSLSHKSADSFDTPHLLGGKSTDAFGSETLSAMQSHRESEPLHPVNGSGPEIAPIWTGPTLTQSVDPLLKAQEAGETPATRPSTAAVAHEPARALTTEGAVAAPAPPEPTATHPAAEAPSLVAPAAVAPATVEEKPSAIAEKTPTMAALENPAVEVHEHPTTTVYEQPAVMSEQKPPMATQEQPPSAAGTHPTAGAEENRASWLMHPFS